MWQAVLGAAANLASGTKASPSRSDAAGGYTVAPLSSPFTVNISGDGIGAGTPWGAVSLVALGVGLFMVARWTARP